jgi:hypothetical protein
MRPYLITAKLMRPSNMKRFPTPDLADQRIVTAPRLDQQLQVSKFESSGSQNFNLN